MTDTYRTPAPMVEHGNAPQGLGGWVAFEKAFHPGGKADDLRVAVAMCLRAGIRWVALRAGAGSNKDAALDETSVAAFQAAGIDVYVWVFAYKNTQAGEIAIYKRWFSCGAKGALINAEFEYESATADDARKLVEGIRTAWLEVHGTQVPPSFVAHCPPDYLGAGVKHALRDELVALDYVCDAIMPQVYAWEHDDSGHTHHLRNIEAGYVKRGIDLGKVWPVLCTYRPKQRGGKPVPSMTNEPRVVADDLAAGLDYPWVRDCQAPSIYSMDAIVWINGEHDQVVNMLEDRAKGPDTQPQTPTGKSSQKLKAVRPEEWSPQTSAHTVLPDIVPKLPEE